MKVFKLVIEHKDPDGFHEMARSLGLSEELRDRYLRWGEHANIEIEVNEKLEILSGRFVPFKE